MLQSRTPEFLQVAMLVILVAVPAQGEWLSLSEDATMPTAPRIHISRVASGMQEISIVIDGLDLTGETVDGLATVAVTIPGCAPTLEYGAPELPVLARGLRLPHTGQPRLTIESVEWRTVSDLPPRPSRGELSRSIDPGSVARVFGEAYRSSDVWPAAPASLGRPFLIRDQRGVSLRVNPVRWDPVRGRLEVMTHLTARVVADGDGGVNIVDCRIAAAPVAFAPVVRAVFGAEADKGAESEGEGSGYGESEHMLMVTVASMRSEVEVFATWKRECGHLVEVVTMEDLGGTIIDLRDAISTRYFSEDGLAYLVLVGDVAQVPTGVGSYNGADSDGIFGLLSGDDLYVDVLISRLPACNGSEAGVMIERTVAYERDVQSGSAWCTRAAGIASDEGDPADYERADWLRDDLLAAGLIDVARIYQGFGGSRDGIMAAVDAGVGLVNYLGHGSGTGWLSVPFVNADVHALTNTAAWPWIIDVSCSNGDFSLDECFAEAWLRSSHGGQPTGAVAMISASTATSWVPPTVMQAAMIDELTTSGETELGALYAAGVAAVLVQYDGLSQADKLMEQYNLFGDVSLRVRWRDPEPLAVAHATWLPAGTDEWRISLPEGTRASLTTTSETLDRGDAPDGGGILAFVPSRPLVIGETVVLTVMADHAETYRVELPVAVEPTASNGDSPPRSTVLAGSWPNPFNPATTVGFSLAVPGPVSLTVHDARGCLVRRLVSGSVDAGSHEVTWDGCDHAGRRVASGLYLARLAAGGTTQVIKMTLAK